MYTKTLLAAAVLLVAGAAQAQSVGTCPTLPANSGLGWETLAGADYTFCKAISLDSGRQVLAVMITTGSTFRPRRPDRLHEARIDGTETWWYRGELSGSAGTEVREALVEIDRKHMAHISLRAASEDELSHAMSLAEALRFDDVRLSIN
ncbi:MAG TPA: hypothetical protein VIG97_07655 [Luteimonas sp.]